MGLLDLMNSDTGVLGASLLAAGAPQAVRPNFGQGLLQAMGTAQQWKAQEEERRQKAAMAALQMQQVQQAIAHGQFQQQQAQQQAARQQALESLPAQFMRNGVKPETMDNRDVGQPGEQPVPSQGFDMAGYANAMFKYDPKTALALQASMHKDNTPIKVAPGEALVAPGTFKPLFTNPKESATPESIRAIESVYGANSPQAIKAKQDYITKITTHQPPTQVSVNTEKPLMNSIASKLGEQIDSSLAQAKAATQAIGTAQTIKQALDSGKVVSGPGASFRVAGLQLGQMLGVGGKDAAEVLGNTRTVIQSMAKAELDAAQQMKGQGQITEAERDIIRRAASGNIDSLTSPEIRLLADTMEKTARFKIQAHKANVGALAKMPNAAPILPFYQVEDPGAYQPSSQPQVRRYNQATGRIE